MVKRLISYIKDHPAQVRRFLLWAAILLAVAVVAVVGAYYFDVATESRWFCGQLCHANQPQYVTQEVSPHADVECGICHIGPGLPPKIIAKLAGTKELFLLVTNSFERPIEHPVARLKPADVICEQCHSPHHAYEDQIERISRFAADETNSETQINLAMRIGGGEHAEETTGAHWHIDNAVWYVSRDVDHQDIPWVEVMGDDGRMVEYQATDDPLTVEELEDKDRREMDCMDCHNRATHMFRNPEDRVDEALASGEIDVGLPYVKREATRLLSAGYATQADGVAAMADLAQYYQSEHPDVYAAQKNAIDQAVAALQTIYHETVFPEMRITWDVYPDNLGHKDFPGCFRCHDGSLVNEQEEAIPSNCTLCHSAPVVAGDGQEAALRGVVLPEEKPDSHRAADFYWEHRILADDTCAECHGAVEYGTDNTSFCANGICHGGEWPEPAAVADFVHPVQMTGQHAQASCNECHQGVREPSLDDCSGCHQPPGEAHFGPECAQCHAPEGWSESAASWVADAPSDPHGLAAVDCLLCHVDGGPGPIPGTHKGFPSESCSRCHETTSVAQVPDIPHMTADDDERGDCLLCHGEGALQPTSAIHQGISSEVCLQCHTSVPIEGVPGIPHEVAEGARCQACHGEGRLASLPSGHAGWPDEACLLCHVVVLID